MLKLSVVDTLESIAPAIWDRLAGDNPFLRHGFLHGLEATGCLAPQGWYPQHLLLTDGEDLRAALPLYVRDNSYGEFVFDWSWAEAYARSGAAYYPKLVSAVPFSPVTGQRVLLRVDDPEREAISRQLIASAVQACDDNEFSSWHCLFPHDDEVAHYERAGLALRLGCQYHWFNAGYADFDTFLLALNSKKRKQIKRERRLVAEHGIDIEVLCGADIEPRHWSVFHRFYCSTFQRKWGEPRLTEAFFQSLESRLPGAAVLILARDGQRYVAGAFALQGGGILYGRHWGCSAQYDNLHFELCYYQTIDFCIRNGLTSLDAGAQGEHKLARGFVPVRTWSAHYLRDLRFRKAVQDFVRREHAAMEAHIETLATHVAFRQN